MPQQRAECTRLVLRTSNCRQHLSLPSAEGMESAVEGDGFLLLYKRLEKGKFQWPRSENEALRITPQQYRWLMEGLSIQQPKAHKKMDKIKFG